MKKQNFDFEVFIKLVDFVPFSKEEGEYLTALKQQPNKEERDKIKTVYEQFNRWHSTQEFAQYFNHNGGMKAIELFIKVLEKAIQLKISIGHLEEELQNMSILYGYDYANNIGG